MSRLCCSDRALFARYSRGELMTDLRLKSSLGTACHSISSVLLQTYSVQLADFATVALTSSSNELVLEDASPRALELFVHGVYGRSFEKTLTDCLTESNIDICDIKEIWAFGHRYNIGQIELAICDLITSHLPELGLSEANDVIDFYNSVPTESDAVQDAIFQILLGFQEKHGFLIMESKEHIFIRIAPRHVNEIFSVTWDNAPFMLLTLQLCVKHQELIKGLWDLKVRIPFPPDLKRIQDESKFDILEMDKWLAFKNELRTSEFKTGVARWCEHMQGLLYRHVAQERDSYKQHIQANNPHKRIKIVAGQVQLLRPT